MKNAILSNVLAVVLGAITGTAFIWAGEAIMPSFFPFLKTLNMNDSVAVEMALANMPLAAFFFLLVNYAIASFAGGMVATVLSKSVKAGPTLVVGGILTVAGILNLIMLRHPIWFSIVNLLEYMPCAYAGYLLAPSKRLTIKV